MCCWLTSRWMAVRTRRSAPSQSATSSPLATASPPIARIASTTSPAGPSELPVPSMLYYTQRYHTARQRREDLGLGLVVGMVPYHLKRRASPMQWLGFLAGELVHLPSTRRRVRRSRELAAQMVAEGPKIPELQG